MVALANLEQLRKDRKEALARQLEIEKAAEDNENGNLSAEQWTEYQELDTKVENLDGQIAEAEKFAALAKKRADRSAKAVTPPPRRSQPDTGTEGRVAIEGKGPEWQKDPRKGFASHREYFMSVMETAKNGRLEDERLKFLAVGSDEASGVSDPYGGFLLPSGFSPNLLTIGTEGDPTAGRTQPVPMTTQTLEIPARVDNNHTSSVSGGLQVYRRNETDTVSATRMEFKRVKLEATMLFGLSYASEEILARSPISFVALLETGFNDEFAAKILKEKLFGTGSGQYEGVVNAACTVSQAKETGQAAATIVYENVIKMRSRVWRYGNAIWLANHDALPQLMLMNQSVGTGGVPVWQPSAREDHPDTLLGRPLFFTEFAETVGTKGDLICGNWSQYLEAQLEGEGMAESIHVRFVNHERAFKFWLENDGRPWWLAALTPNQSSNTLSPFVVLDARS